MPPVFDFPNTPNVGDLFQDSTSGAVYKWNGYAWVGGVTGIGLQSVKETRYLVAGSLTHTRDPKNSTALATVYVMGAMGGTLASPAWASGNIVATGCGGAGAFLIKYNYALAPTCAVVVGASSTTAAAAASSFDGVLIANGGGIGQSSIAASATLQVTGGGAAPALPTTGDENYAGVRGQANFISGGAGTNPVPPVSFVRGVMRKAIGATSSGAGSLAALAGDAGLVIVLENLNP